MSKYKNSITLTDIEGNEIKKEVKAFIKKRRHSDEDEYYLKLDNLIDLYKRVELIEEKLEELNERRYRAI